MPKFLVQSQEVNERDELWFEIHDLESRQGRIEERMACVEAVGVERSKTAEIRRRLTWDVLPFVLGVAGTTVGILTAVHVL